MRYKQVNPAGATTYYVDKLMEIEFAGSAVDFRSPARLQLAPTISLLT